jgi:hypothetical protein
LYPRKSEILANSISLFLEFEFAHSEKWEVIKGLRTLDLGKFPVVFVTVNWVYEVEGIICT